MKHASCIKVQLLQLWTWIFARSDSQCHWTWSCHVWNPCMLKYNSCILHVRWIKHAGMKKTYACCFYLHDSLCNLYTWQLDNVRKMLHEPHACQAWFMKHAHAWQKRRCMLWACAFASTINRRHENLVMSARNAFTCSRMVHESCMHESKHRAAAALMDMSHCNHAKFANTRNISKTCRCLHVWKPSPSSFEWFYMNTLDTHVIDKEVQ